MNNIKFIPLIELPTKKDAESAVPPKGSYLDNPIEWDLYMQKELRKNYQNAPQPITPGIWQYPLLNISRRDLKKAIELHVGIGDTDLKDTCSLFGGYAIAVGGTIELYPQCCGMLEEIQQWKVLLNEKFKDFYLRECHPAPLISKRGKEVVIYCRDDFESFIPATTNAEIRLDYSETKQAFEELMVTLKEFSKDFDSLSADFGVARIFDILIWGEKSEE